MIRFNESSYLPQVLQVPPEQPEQAEPEALMNLPPLLKAQADISFLTASLPHLGHLIPSIRPPKTNSSKVSPHC
jgi:hypothetical protein